MHQNVVCAWRLPALSATQGVHIARTGFATQLDMPLEKVRVLAGAHEAFGWVVHRWEARIGPVGAEYVIRLSSQRQFIG